jgi:putative ABC transport system substrate-binding protein
MANDASLNIPIIFCMVSNPSRYGLAGANLAGISMDVSGETQFALYKTVVPNLKTIGVIYDPEKSNTLIEEASIAAEKLGLELIKVPVSSHKDVPKALRSILGKIDALWMVPDDTVLTTQSFRFFLVTSFEKKLPFLAISDIFVKVGALATIAPDPIEMGQQLGQLVTKLQSGQLDLTKTNILPPTESNLVINVKTAEKIGITIDPEILQAASKLYQ